MDFILNFKSIFAALLLLVNFSVFPSLNKNLNQQNECNEGVDLSVEIDKSIYVKNFSSGMPVRVIISNNGSEEVAGLNLNFQFREKSVNEIFSGSILPAQKQIFTFSETIDLLQAGIDTLSVFAHSPTDPVQTNNSHRLAINSFTGSNALSFEGDDYIDLSNNSVFDFSTHFTIETWFNVQLDKQGDVISKHTNTSGVRSGYTIEYSNGMIKAIIGTGSWKVVEAPVSLNQWYHLAMTYDSDTLKMYLNGEFIGAQTGQMLSNTIPLWIGGSKNYITNFFAGHIDELRFWSAERNIDQIRENMYREISETSPYLLAYYNFNRGISEGDNTAVGILPDMTANNFHGILNNFELKNGQNGNFFKDCNIDFESPVPDVAELPDIISECEVTDIPAQSASDNCSGTVAGIHNASLPINSQGETLIIWTYTDAKGNVTTQNQKIKIEDKIPPVIVCCDSVTKVIAKTDSVYIVVEQEFDPVSVTENCEIKLLRNNFNNSGTLEGARFHKGVTIVKWEITDKADNTSFCEFTVNIQSECKVPPALVRIPADRVFDIGEVFSFTEIKDIFTDLNGNEIKYRVLYAAPDSSYFSNQLPEWLSVTEIATEFDFSGKLPYTCANKPHKIRFEAYNECNDLSFVDFEIASSAANSAPVVNATVGDVAVFSGDNFAFQLPVDLFSDDYPDDNNGRDNLTYTSSLKNDSPLPEWLVFDAPNLSYSGFVPCNWCADTIFVKVKAKDACDADIFTEFNLMIKNKTPKIIREPDPRRLASGLPFEFEVPRSNFADEEKCELYFTSKERGSSRLPDWLNFETTPTSLRYWGIAPEFCNYSTTINIFISYACGETISCGFFLSVRDSSPSITKPIPSVAYVPGTVFSYDLDKATIKDDRPFEELELKLTNTYDDHLPDWITFDPIEFKIHGTAPENCLLEFPLKVTATDRCNGEISTNFTVYVMTESPQIVNPIKRQIKATNCYWEFTIPNDVFTVSDGSEIVYSTGTKPSWASYNAATRTYSGTTPNYEDLFDVQIRAKTACSSTKSHTFTLEVTAPVPPVPDQANLPIISGECSVEITTKPTAIDYCIGKITGTTNDPLYYDKQGNYTVTWTYTGDAGRVTTQTQSVVVKDNTLPAFTPVGNQNVDANAFKTYIVQGTEFDLKDVADNCGVAQVINNFNSLASLEGAVLPEGITTITWSVTDIAGNEVNNIFDVNVADNVSTWLLPSNKIEAFVTPNPSDGFIVVHSPIIGSFTVTIADITGKILIKTTFSGQERTIDISKLERGVYMVELKTENTTLRSKIVKK